MKNERLERRVVKKMSGLRPGKQDKGIFMSPLKTTIPIFLGYIPLGIAFGLLLRAYPKSQ